MNAKLFTDERAISPVVGVALLIAIAVILATVIGTVVLDLGPGGANTPQADLASNYSTSNSSLTIRHRGGDPLPGGQVVLRDEAGNEYTLSNETSELTAGQSITITNTELAGVGSEETITLLWEARNSEKETILAEFEP